MRLRLAPIPLLLLAAIGCAQKTSPDSLKDPQRPVAELAAQLTHDQIRSEVMSFADTYVTLTAQSLDELGKRTKRPEVADWALRYKIATTSAAYTNAASPNPIVALLDTVVYATLKRAGIEEYWVPTILHDEGQGVLTSFRRAEADAWKLAERALTPSQVAELHELIEQWQRDNPRQYYVSHIRFTDFSDSRHRVDRSQRATAPGSLFALLFLDPLASLDPVTRELHGYRMLTERLVYVAMRMPALLSWQLELAVMQAGENPRMLRFLESADKFNNNLKAFNDTSLAFTNTLKQYPHDLAKEREALIKEFLEGIAKERAAMFDGLTVQRQGLSKDLQIEHDRISKLLAEARATLKDIRETSAAASGSANNTVAHAEESSSRLASRVFTYLLILLLVLLIVGPLMLLIYRYAASRLPASTASRQATPEPRSAVVVQPH